MTQYNPKEAVNSPHHKINPGQVSSAYTIEALLGERERN